MPLPSNLEVCRYFVGKRMALGCGTLAESASHTTCIGIANTEHAMQTCGHVTAYLSLQFRAVESFVWWLHVAALPNR